MNPMIPASLTALRVYLKAFLGLYGFRVCSSPQSRASACGVGALHPYQIHKPETPIERWASRPFTTVDLEELVCEDCPRWSTAGLCAEAALATSKKAFVEEALEYTHGSQK